VLSVFAALLVWIRRRKFSAALSPAITFVIAAMFLSSLLACGGGGGASSGSTAHTVQTTSPGTYTLQLSAVSGGSAAVNQSLTLVVQ